MNSEANDFNDEMSKLIERFNRDVKKVMKDKRKCMAELTSNSIRKTKDAVENLECNLLQSREKVVEDFKTEFYSFIQLAVSELNKVKEMEEKVKELKKLQELKEVKRKEEIFKQLKQLKALNEDFSSDMNKLDDTHEKQNSELLKDTKKKMMHLQKKILMETQAQEKLNLKKMLETDIYK